MSPASIPSAPLPALQDGTDALALADGEEALSLHRVDQPHKAPMETNAAEALPADTTSKPAGLRDTISDALEFDPERIRAAHAEDLISFLQRWSEELDQRASRLHADIATHERRERAFRLWMQNRRAELESQIEDYRDAQSKAEAAARRMALTDN